MATHGYLRQGTDPDAAVCSAEAAAPEAGQAVLHSGVPNAVYHARAEWSKSQLYDFRRRGPRWFCARHVEKTAPPYSSAALSRGTLVHACLEIGSLAFWRAAVTVPDKYLTPAGAISFSKESKAWQEDQGPDAILVPPADAHAIRQILRELYANRAARDIYARVAEHELSCIYKRPDGHAIRCRFDAVLDDGSIIDYKTSKEEHPLKTWASSAIDLGYHYQDALYSQCAAAAGLIPGMTFVVLSTTSYEVQVVTLPRHAVEPCHRWITEDLDEIAERLATGNWLPEGYGEVNELAVPSHLLRRWT
jgi:hypothetical protein